LRLRLFGHLAVNDNEGKVYLPRTRKTRALMAVLAIASPKPVLRSHLASLLWSRRENEQARASLRQSVHELQETLGPSWSHVFIADRHHLSLRGEDVDIDALSLTQRTRISPGLLDQYEDVLLEDLNGLDPAFDQWLEDERARFVRIRRTIGESLLAQHHDPLAAIDVAEQILVIDRGHEGAWRTIMRSHAEQGDIRAALAAYDRCRSILAEVSGQSPSPETEDLIARIRAQGQLTYNQPAQIQSGHLSEVPAPAPVQLRPTGRRDRTTLRLRVLPLRAVGEERDDGLGIGLAEEISAGLSRFRWISCLPAVLWPSGTIVSSVGGAPSVETGDGVWSGAEADLILDGTIQRAVGRVRIIVRLLDMRAGGEIVWAARFDREMTDPLALQDELSAAIVAQVDPELMQHEGRRSAATGSIDPHRAGFAAASSSRDLPTAARQLRAGPPTVGDVAASGPQQLGRPWMARILEPSVRRPRLGGRFGCINGRGCPASRAGRDA